MTIVSPKAPSTKTRCRSNSSSGAARNGASPPCRSARRSPGAARAAPVPHRAPHRARRPHRARLPLGTSRSTSPKTRSLGFGIHGAASATPFSTRLGMPGRGESRRSAAGAPAPRGAWCAATLPVRPRVARVARHLQQSLGSAPRPRGSPSRRWLTQRSTSVSNSLVGRAAVGSAELRRQPVIAEAATASRGVEQRHRGPECRTRSRCPASLDEPGRARPPGEARSATRAARR